MNRNPYSTPNSAVLATTATDTFELHYPRLLKTGRGAAWVRQGWQLFSNNWPIWIAISLTFLIILIVLGAIAAFFPFVSLLSGVVGYVWIAGIMQGCRDQESGGTLSLAHLFAGFGANLGALLLVGIVINSLVHLVGFACFGAKYFLIIGFTGSNEELIQYYLTIVADPLREFVLPALFALLFIIPLTMMVWFAPTLIMLHKVPVAKALSLSFSGCLKNFFPFLIYGLIFLGLSILSVFTLFLGLIVLLPLAFTSWYCAYKDIYINT